MFIFEFLNAKEYSTDFCLKMEEVYFEFVPYDYNSDALLTYFYFM